MNRRRVYQQQWKACRRKVKKYLECASRLHAKDSYESVRDSVDTAVIDQNSDVQNISDNNNTFERSADHCSRQTLDGNAECFDCLHTHNAESVKANFNGAGECTLEICDRTLECSNFTSSPDLPTAELDGFSNLLKGGESQAFLHHTESDKNTQTFDELAWVMMDHAENKILAHDSDSESHTNKPVASLREDIAKWYCRHTISHAALSDLLKVLETHGCDVPITASTLLSTPRSVETQQKSGGSYKYLGLANSLEIILQQKSESSWKHLQILQVQVNIDGLPLFKSSATTLWPILCTISNLSPLQPFAVAFYCGTKKPSNLDFLKDFIEEMKHLMLHGLTVNGTVMGINLQCVICDAPAKALVKGTIQFNGTYGCDMCEQKGRYIGRMVFLENNATRRTDESFRKQSNQLHHKQVSPFCDLPLDMVNDFPIDYMHQVNLGVTKRLILGWICGSLTSRISAKQIESINERILELRKFMPKEFVRKPRTLDVVLMWKAAEFRTFLMYTGPLVLKDVLNKDQYIHFMSLSCGITILMHEQLALQHKDYANKLLHFFVEMSIKLYGEKFVTYNVHSLTHLSDVADRFGCLQNCNAYPFENYMQTLKRLVHNSKNPLVQVVKRLYEMERSTSLNRLQEKNFGSVRICVTKPDNCYITDAEEYCLCHELLFGATQAICEVFTNKSSLYSKPCDSRLLGIQKVLVKASVMKQIPVCCLVKKAIFIPLDCRYAAVIPLFHGL
jgi:hypothetical protein